MTKLHELLAAEKTSNAAWHEVQEGTLKKFKDPTHYFNGHSKSLEMIAEGPESEAIQKQAGEEKPVTTTVYDTLDYALDLFARAEDLLFQKNKTNQIAVGTVMWQGAPFLIDMPVDELLGLENRLAKLRQVFAEMPTLDATKHWKPATEIGKHIWQLKLPEKTTKTEKQLHPVIMHEATKEHPAQVQAISKDVVVGTNTMMRRSGAATALQKAEAIKVIDMLLVEIKQARMRANSTEASREKVGHIIADLLLQPLRMSREDHQ
jgi:hypothetical protein